MLKLGQVLIIFFLAGVLAFAGENNSSETKKMMKGVIEKIDLDTKKLTLKENNKNEPTEFSFKDDLFVWTKGGPLKLQELKAGNQVSVYCDSATHVAAKIFVKST